MKILSFRTGSISPAALLAESLFLTCNSNFWGLGVELTYFMTAMVVPAFAEVRIATINQAWRHLGSIAGCSCSLQLSLWFILHIAPTSQAFNSSTINLLYLYVLLVLILSYQNYQWNWRKFLSFEVKAHTTFLFAIKVIHLSLPITLLPFQLIAAVHDIHKTQSNQKWNVDSEIPELLLPEFQFKKSFIHSYCMFSTNFTIPTW